MMLLFVIVLAACCQLTISLTIDVPKCNPPDIPKYGGYGPQQEEYEAGDHVHYYCETNTHIAGNYFRRCDDTGDWSGETPLCDTFQDFASMNQSSTADPFNENDAERATDGDRETCSSTRGIVGDTWIGVLSSPGELLRVSIFAPTGDVAYEVFMVNGNGIELSCGRKVATNVLLNWEHHNCPGPNNHGAVWMKIVSLSSAPLQLCEVTITVLTVPTCVDPKRPIENGRLILSRKTGTLFCDKGYSKSTETRIECKSNGRWNRKSLQCFQEAWEVERRKPPSRHDP